MAVCMSEEHFSVQSHNTRCSKLIYMFMTPFAILVMNAVTQHGHHGGYINSADHETLAPRSCMKTDP